MKRHTTTLLIVMVLAGAAWGQDRSRNRPPPSKPATREEVDALTSAVAELRKQVEELRAKVDDLIEALKAAKPEAKQRAAGVAAANGKIVNGMTMAQVEKLAGSKGTLESSADGVAVYRWRLDYPAKLIEGAAEYPQIFFGQFEDGRLVSIELQRAPNSPAREVPGGSFGPGVR